MRRLLSKLSKEERVQFEREYFARSKRQVRGSLALGAVTFSLFRLRPLLSTARIVWWSIAVTLMAWPRVSAEFLGEIEIPQVTDVREVKIPPRLSVLTPDENGWLKIGGEYQDWQSPGQVFTLQRSSDLVRWDTAAVLLRTPFQYSDPLANGNAPGFYRMLLTNKAETNDWTNLAGLGEGPFFHAAECATKNPLRWAKFVIDLQEPHRVYFQNVSKHLLHYDFAVNRLPRFSGMSPQQFTEISMRRANQQAMVGAVLAPYYTREFGIQILGQDPYPPELIASVFKVVRSVVANSEDARAIYLPSYEQEQTAWENQNYFATQGIEIATVDRWGGEVSNVYSSGWAVGRLKFIPAAEIVAAYADGRLGPADILLTDRIPAEVPYVAGVISLAPATPNSHVAILAQSYDVPFVYVAEPSEQSRVKELGGHEVMLRTGARLNEGKISIVDLGEAIDPGLKEDILALKKAPPLNIQGKERYGSIHAATENLTRSDVRYFGGKAANFGLLRRVIPENAPEAIAFSFDLWDGFMDQVLPSGGTLRSEIGRRLGSFSYPANMTALRTEIGAIKELITKTARFSNDQQAAVLLALERFDKQRNIRFRSSTNVEDTEQFTGAGLYDSYSGCAADDLDLDGLGPSLCDPTESNERGVFRAIQKVYASFYNENAFLERLRHGVDESKVGMALLVHHSTPDEFELANGVADLTYTRSGTFIYVAGKLVTQAGAVSVANPEGGARAEVVYFSYSNSLTNVNFSDPSSLVPLGTKVMHWPGDYEKMAGMLAKSAVAYGELDPTRAGFRLDFEYKKVAGGALRVKQIREIPVADPTGKVATFLLSEPQEFYPLGNVFSMHRLKSRWVLASKKVGIRSNDLAEGLYNSIDVEYRDGDNSRKLAGSPESWPGARDSIAVADGQVVVTNTWSGGEESETLQFSLITKLPQSVYATESPMLTLKEAVLEYRANYREPVPMIDQFTGTTTVTNDTVQLLPVKWSGTNFRQDWLHATNSVFKISGTYEMLDLLDIYSKAPANPECDLFGPKESYAFAGRTGAVTIEGLLTEPLQLTSDLSQTYLQTGRFGHDFVQNAIFEPWLEPGISDELKEELTRRNIRLLHYYSFYFGRSEERWRILGLDGKFREYP